MENPAKEITDVIHLLTQSPPSIQREAIETYFMPNASFTHPFCRTGSWGNSRFLIRAIYRWYKIMSPRIDITVNSVAYDARNLILYVDISQVFRIWVVPFYCAPVNLTSVMTLEQSPDDGKYYIQSQNDLYQADEFIKFVLPPGWMLVWLWHFLSTFFCVVGSCLLWPISAMEQWVWEQDRQEKSGRSEDFDDGIELRDLERKSIVDEVWWSPTGTANKRVE
ncbi:hypothetical protein K458DRAFT_414857 [Lentithecium fluviatile CBS 122367]|uniref:SigF-like NTF2-like domain-containing protein n=1 Tax=Lentithecium fluviatile CBS 122367 TaxID=1168545 RepID=A0A6G1JC39_9PLEO|nr:hypothetical protein K458DRAFT_414857 [Lentithecium fluviatile CBS 122367]